MILLYYYSSSVVQKKCVLDALGRTWGMLVQYKGVPTDKTQHTCEIVRRCEDFVPCSQACRDNIDIVVVFFVIEAELYDHAHLGVAR